MKTRIGLAATMALAVVLALRLTGTTAAAAAENAVVHWSGIAEGAIAAGRPPASSSVLAGMVHGAMYDAVAAIEGGLAPFATSVTAPPEAAADAAVAQAARDVLAARVPLQAAARPWARLPQPDRIRILPDSTLYFRQQPGILRPCYGQVLEYFRNADWSRALLWAGSDRLVAHQG